MDDLNNLEALAASTDAANVDATAASIPVDPNAPPPPPSLEEQALDGVKMLAGMICGYAPECQSVFTPEANKMAAQVMVPVMEKYGWTMFEMPCEFVAAIVVGPMLYKASVIVATKMKSEKLTGQPKNDNAPDLSVKPDGLTSPQMALYT